MNNFVNEHLVNEGIRIVFAFFKEWLFRRTYQIINELPALSDVSFRVVAVYTPVASALQ